MSFINQQKNKMKNIEPIIEKLKALRERLPIPKYESGYFLTDEEWDQVFTALEENEKLKESCTLITPKL